MRSTSFHIVNLGCKVNRVEADSMHAALLGHGSVPVVEEAADLIIVNTCTVTAEADKKARKAVHHALSVNPVAQVVVTGCAAAINAETFTSMSSRVRVAGKAELEMQLAERLNMVPLRTGDGFNTRVGLKVQDGCDNACTYCIVHVARGKARSIAADSVAREARRYFEAGVKEIVLAGIDIGAYADGDVRLPQLARLLLAQADEASASGDRPARIRISSIEPRNVDDELVSVLATAEGRVCRHLHLPLQSGSDKVLREMDRPYTAREFALIVEKLRAQVEGISLSTDVIVGFPGETEEDFEATCDLVRSCGFMRLHVFPYSRREGTPAAARSDQVPADMKRDRAARLRAIGQELGTLDRESRAGTTELCLVEGEFALSESYHEVLSPFGALSGSLIPIVL